MLESGRHATVRDLAKAEVINESYLGRILRLRLLSPSIVEAILEGRQPPTLELDSLLKQFPVACHQQTCGAIHRRHFPHLAREPKCRSSRSADGAHAKRH